MRLNLAVTGAGNDLRLGTLREGCALTTVGLSRGWTGLPMVAVAFRSIRRMGRPICMRTAEKHAKYGSWVGGLRSRATALGGDEIAVIGRRVVLMPACFG